MIFLTTYVIVFNELYFFAIKFSSQLYLKPSLYPLH